MKTYYPLRHEMADNLLRSEWNAAKLRRSKEREQKENLRQAQQKERRQNAEQEEQAKFKEELAAVISFTDALAERDVLPNNMYKTHDMGTSIEIFTGLFWGYIKKEDDDWTGRSCVDGYYDKYIDKMEADFIKNPFKHCILTLVPPLSEECDRFIHRFEAEHHPSNIARRFAHSSFAYDYTIQPYMLGGVFERGATTAQDISDFLQKLTAEIYARFGHNEAKMNAFGEVIWDQFGIDKKVIGEAAEILLVAQHFTTVTNEDIKVSDPSAFPDMEVLAQRTARNVKTEIADAFKGTDPMAVMEIGEDVSRAVRILTEELINIPSTDLKGEDVALLEGLRDNLETFRKESAGSVGTNLWDKVIGDDHKPVFSGLDTDHAPFSVQLKTLASVLEERRLTIADRVRCLSQCQEHIGTLSVLASHYKNSIAAYKADKSADQNDVETICDLWSQHVQSLNDLSQHVATALDTEKQAYRALQKASVTIPAMALSFMKLANDWRKIRTSLMEDHAENTENIMLSELGRAMERAETLAITDNLHEIFGDSITQIDEIARLVQKSGNLSYGAAKHLRSSPVTIKLKL